MVENSIKSIIIFIAGVGIGVAASWQILKKKYEQIAKEEIDSVKEVYSSKKPKTNIEEPVITKKDINNYSKIVSDNGYNGTKSKNEEKEDTKMENKPYVISPEEFDELGYETVTLTYYSDGILADDFDNVIEDVDGLVSKDSLTHFGEYEDDAVYVRNDKYKTDYEILLDIGKYEDSLMNNPLYPGDDE